MSMNSHSRLENVLSSLSENGYSMSSLISDVLLRCYTLESQRVRAAREELERDAVDICARLLTHTPSSTPVTQWALQTTRSVLRSEIEELTKRAHGLHFDARAATAEQIESTFMPQLAATMRQIAPSFWCMIFDLLGGLDERRMSLAVDPIGMNLADLFEESESVLEEIGGDMEPEDDRGYDNGADLSREDNLPHQKRSRQGVSERNTAIRVIVSYNYIGTVM